MIWDYAYLSMLAKAYGGPERLVEAIFQAGLKKGCWRATLIALGIFVVSAGIVILIKHISKQKYKSEKDVEVAKQLLIEGIREYDRTHC